MKPLLFDPEDGSLVSNPSSKGKYTDPRPDSTAKDRSQHDGNGARGGGRRHNDGYPFLITSKFTNELERLSWNIH